jgi:L-ascorbate metabolism protein UlaG (beta-lactamase superfamily)
MQIIHDLYRPEVVLLPVGDHFTMGTREAEYACKLLEPRVVVPMHFGTFPMLTCDPHDLRPIAQRQDFDLWEMQPGVRRELSILSLK